MPSGGHSKGGRKKKPTKLHELQGTAQPCRVNKDEIKPKEIDGAECPDWLAEDEVAKGYWDWLVNRLASNKILTDFDLPAIEMFCVVYAGLREVTIDMRKMGRVIYTEKMDSDGNQYIDAKPSPLVSQFNNLTTQFRMFCSMFGISPSERPKISINTEKPDDKFDF
jgi:P27 family predicted phage terminase small subunit